ncbi:MAG: hypothetical protein ABR915_14295 [Thermoguttaceae bacterium]
MNLVHRLNWCWLPAAGIGLLLLALLPWGGLLPPDAKAADPPADLTNLPPAPKVSEFAPAEDLVYQMDKYIDELQKGTENKAAYDDLPEGKVSQTGNTMILLAIALGVSDEGNKCKANAGALAAACQKLAVTTEYAPTKQAVEGVVAAADGKGKGQIEVKWAKLAKLPELMKQVPNVNTKLKTYTNPKYPERLVSKAKESRAASATLAVIAQGDMANVGDTIKPTESKKWFEFSKEMREAATAVNRSIRAKDVKAVSENMDRLQQSCDDCHVIFHPKKGGEK